MTWNLVEVWEPEPPPATEPVHWLLWTLEPAATLAEALEMVRKHTCRWPIEEFHVNSPPGFSLKFPYDIRTVQVM